MKQTLTRHWLCARLLIAAVLCMGGAAMADWAPGDVDKMHYPQLPDPGGWDIAFDDYADQQRPLADDWRCTETGPVSAIHLWVSWRGDQVGQISALNVSIHGNIAQGPDGFSIPGEKLWQKLLYGLTHFNVVDYGLGDQGWYDPFTGEYVPFDHQVIQQVNIDNIPEPFVQEEGEIYWLVVKAWFTKVGTIWPGWKTSRDHWNDDAVQAVEWQSGPINAYTWEELRDPITDESLDLAFVIAPEPASVALLALGALALVRRRRR